MLGCLVLNTVWVVNDQDLLCCALSDFKVLLRVELITANVLQLGWWGWSSTSDFFVNCTFLVLIVCRWRPMERNNPRWFGYNLKFFCRLVFSGCAQTGIRSFGKENVTGVDFNLIFWLGLVNGIWRSMSSSLLQCVVKSAWKHLLLFRRDAILRH